MLLDGETLPLLEWLRGQHSILHGKLLELRKALEQWLGYVTATFPHYTRHTIQHSDIIVSQISKLVFHTDDFSLVVPFSPLEVYILCAAAYLHDAGMVASEDEKQRLLRSDEWIRWAERPDIAEQLDAARTFNHEISDIADYGRNLRLRYLIADFLRSRHHLRAKLVIDAHVEFHKRFGFSDQQLTNAVTAVCMGHGLSPTELLDETTYPTLTDILEQPVNVRLLAVLLRFGDLLDLSTDRACPMLMSAACANPGNEHRSLDAISEDCSTLHNPDQNCGGSVVQFSG
jgi:hypothetical protein